MERVEAKFSSNWNRFSDLPESLTYNAYNRQYANHYKARLDMLRSRCLPPKGLQDDGNFKIIHRIIELEEETPSRVVGTIIKSSPARPKLDSGHRSSFEPISYLGVAYDEADDSFQQSHFCRSEDSIVLEDESGRIELKLCIKDKSIVSGVESLPSGAVIAVDGTVEGSNGIFSVANIHFPQMKCDANDIVATSNTDAYVVFVSGLNCGAEELSDEDTSLHRDMLIDYLTGHFSIDHGPNICRVIIAGGGCARPLKPKSLEKTSKEINRGTGVTPVGELDCFISQLCAAGIQVDYIPGFSDPTNANWPQKPLHPCLMPMSERYGLLNRSPNPYEATIGGVGILGSDGRNVVDLQRYVAKRCEQESNECKEVEFENISSLEALEMTLLYNHMAPTGPDSLPTSPVENEDPFVINNCPNVYFSGNSSQYETALKNSKTRLICIPSFSQCGQVVKMSLNTLECEAIEFKGIVNN